MSEANKKAFIYCLVITAIAIRIILTMFVVTEERIIDKDQQINYLTEQNKTLVKECRGK